MVDGCVMEQECIWDIDLWERGKEVSQIGVAWSDQLCGFEVRGPGIGQLQGKHVIA